MPVKEFIQDNNGNVTVEKDNGEVSGFNVTETLVVTESGITKGGAALTPGELSALTTAVGGGGGGSGVVDGSKVDITVAGNSWTVNTNVVTNAKMADVPTATIKGRVTAATGDPEDLTGAQVRTLINVANGATANSSDATLLARANHTGTQLASTISDFSTAVAATASVTANTAKVTNATHTGDVTGSTALTIANNVVTNAKLADVATSTIKGRVTAATGDPEDLTPAQVRGLINVADGASVNSSDATLLNRANHTGTQVSSTISDFASASRAQTEAEIAAGTNISITPSGSGASRVLTISASGGSGSVTSVGMSVPTGLSVAGSPITTVGTLAVTLAAGYEIPTRAELNTFLTEDLATDITATKTTFVNADKVIMLDSAAADVPKLITASTLRKLQIGTSLGTSGTVNLDFSQLVGTLQSIVMTGNIVFTASNYEPGVWFELVLDANGSARTLAYPATWKAYGAALPTTLASGKTLTIAIRSRSTTEGAVDVTSALSV